MDRLELKVPPPVVALCLAFLMWFAPSLGQPEVPLQEKKEAVYVVPKSDAEAHVRKRFPLKTVKHVRGSLLPAPSPGSCPE
jgi:hypothetical protein